MSTPEYTSDWRARAKKAEAERDALTALCEAKRPHDEAAAAIRAAMDWRARAEKAEAERDAAQEALARVAEVRDWYAHTSHGNGAFEIARRDAVRHLDDALALAQPATDEGAGASGPHSRACGIKRHEHGRDCRATCPTCHGTEARS